MTSTNQEQDLSTVVSCLTRARSLWFRFAVTSVGFTALIAGIARLKGEPGSTTIGLGFAAAVVSAVALGFLFKNLRVESSPVHLALSENPERVVWVYLSVTQSTVFGLTLSNDHSIRMHLDDGQVVELPSIPADRLEEVIATIVTRAPHAVFGYRDDVARQYHEDPKLVALVGSR